MSTRSERLWRGFAILAAFTYLVAMFAPWRSSVSLRHQGLLRELAETFTKAYGTWGSVLGIASLVLCYLILVFALLGPRRSALSLERLRTLLAISLVAFTVLNLVQHLSRAFGNPPLVHAYKDVRYLGYGTWAALGSSLVLLLAFSVLDAGGLGRLLDRLPAWARLDRLEAPDEAAREPVVSTAERSHRRWSGVLAVALVVYLLSLFTDWWQYSSGSGGGGNSHVLSLLNMFSTETLHLTGFQGIGEFSALAALAALVVTGHARHRREHRLERLRTALVAFVIGLTLANIVVVWRQTYEGVSMSGLHVARSRPDYGALVTLGAMLLMLVATLVLKVGGWTELVDRLPVWIRPDRIDESPGPR